MPTALTLTEDQIDDLLYLSRTGETSDLKATIDLFAKAIPTTLSAILAAAVDPASGNGLLHMASANCHTDTVKELLSLSSETIDFPLNLQNASGNTPLHWAALNGHMDAVKVLAEAGADVTVINRAGHDAIYAAEANDKIEVAEWLLKSGKGLETGVARSQEVEAESPHQMSAGMEERHDENDEKMQEE